MFHDNPSSLLLAGTTRSLVCSYNTTGLTTNVSWTNNDVAVDTSDSRVTVNTVAESNSTLTFNPLSTSDGAMYECTVMIANGNLSSSTFSAMINLNVTS